MKKLMYKACALLLMAGLATSCVDEVLEVETQSSFDASVVYSNYQLAEYTIFAIAHEYGNTNCYRGRLNVYYGTNTDVELHSSSSHAEATNLTTNSGRNQLSEYNVLPDNSQMSTDNNAYANLMSAIERANLAISGLRTYGNVASNPDMAYLLGEALTYRAFTYYELIKMWGDVPLKTDPVTSDTVYLPKTDRDEIFVQVLNDLEEAIGYLYWPYESTQTSSMDRMNKAFAKGLYARVALAASGYAWRPEEGQVGTGNAGSLRLSTHPELQKSVLYPKALKHLEDVLESNTVSLEGDYEKLWRKFNNSEHLTSSPEVLWVLPMSNNRDRWNYHHAYPHSGGSQYTGGTSSTRGGDTGPNPTLWWKYGKQDVRRDVTCVPFWYNVADGGTGYELRGRANYWFWGKYRFEWMINAPYTGGNDDGIKPIVMRLSDVYLMAAEIAAWSGNLDDAKAHLLKVRERAYKGNESVAQSYVNKLTLGSAVENDNAAIQDYQSEGTIMKAIIDERGLELAGEMLRKQDLIRWGLLKLKLDEASKDMKALANLEGDYAAYAAYAEETDVKDSNSNVIATCKEYSIYWRQTKEGIEIYGLDADQIGKAPADYTETEPNGWEKEGFISPIGFFNNKLGTWGQDDSYRWSTLYRNDFNDPYPRSTWPIFNIVLSSMQGSLVNDFGY